MAHGRFGVVSHGNGAPDARMVRGIVAGLRPHNQLRAALAGDNMEEIKIICLGTYVQPSRCGFSYKGRVFALQGLAPTLNGCGGGNLQPSIICKRGKNV